MIKVENVDVWGFDHAIRAMRNPMNSWGKSDSEYKVIHVDQFSLEETKEFIVGEKDLDLMKRLYKSGTEHRTYARMIQASMDIVAPLYWWKEMDRYTIGKSQVSCSTMHKIAEKEFTLDDFSYEHLTDETTNAYYETGDEHNICIEGVSAYRWMIETVAVLNAYRELYLETKNKDYWWQLIQLLPSSYNQRRTVCMSYETVFKIIRERTGHKLDEWNEIVDELKNLPYVKEIIT